MEQGKGIGLVVIHRAVAQLSDGGDHRLLAGVALASDVALDGAYWHPLIGNPVVLAEGAELAQKTAIRMGGIDAGMNRFVGKPFRVEELLEVIDDLTAS